MNPSRHHRSFLLMMLIALLLLLVPRPAGSAPPTARSFEQRCERDMRASIEVTTFPARFAFNNALSSRVLTTRASYAWAGDAMMGMTSSTTRAEIHVDGAALVDPASGRECLAPRITVELGYRPLDVHVARELPPASCSYRAVFAHEMRHVKLYADSLPVVEHRVRAELVSRYGGRPLYAPRDKGVAALHEDINSWLPALIKAELAKVETQQRALDDRDETERLSQLCLGEIGQLMGSSF